MLRPKSYCQSISPALVLLVLFLALLKPDRVAAHHVGDSTPAPLAITEYLIRLDMKPTDTVTRNHLATIFLNQNKLEKAADQFHKVLQIKPADFQALQGMGLTLTRQAEFAEAIVYLNKAAQIQPTDPMVYFHLGQAHEKNRSPQEAEMAYRTALQNGMNAPPEISAAINEALARIKQKIDQAPPGEAQ